MEFPEQAVQDFIKSRVNSRDATDAYQEAWVAFLEGNDPVKHINAFRMRESTRKEICMTDLDVSPNDVYVEERGYDVRVGL